MERGTFEGYRPDMPEVPTDQPLEAKVNPRKWTSKVNIGVVIAVLLVLLIGAGFAIHTAQNRSEVQGEMHRDLSAPNPDR